MMRICLFLCLFVSFNSLFAQSIKVSGSIREKTTWADTVYVTGNVSVDAPLTILPGTYIEFQGLFQIDVHNKFTAAGTEKDSIIFTPKDRHTGWRGIRFLNNTASSAKDTCILSYCVLEYGKGINDFGITNGGVISDYTLNYLLIISDCAVRNNSVTGSGGAIYLTFSDAVIKNCRISNNSAGDSGGGICSGTSYLDCENNIIENNTAKNKGAGIYSYDRGSVFTKNKIINNSVPDLDSGAGSGGGMYCGSNTQVEDNVFENNSARLGGAVYLKSSMSAFKNNRILRNKGFFGGAIYADEFNGEITKNLICNDSADTGGAIYITDCSPWVINNVICNNSASANGGAVYVPFMARPVFVNNTIANNSADKGGALYFYLNISPKIYNTLIYGNTAKSEGRQVYLEADNTNPEFYYCNIQGGIQAFGGYGAGKKYDSLLCKNVIDCSPLFNNPTPNAGTDYDGSLAVWSLKQNSLCIDAGSPDTTGLKIPASDMAGNKRIIGKIDIGAYEYQSPAAVTGKRDQPYEFELMQNYPNPFNPSTNIVYSISKPSHVKLKIYDILGHEIAVLSDMDQDAGKYKVQFNAGDLPSGIYICRIKAGEFAYSRTMVLIK